VAVHAKKAADRPAQSTARSIAEGVALSLVAWVIARVVVGLRWPRARNPFRWNPKVWSHWDTTNYLTIARHGRTFGACGTPGFPYPFFYHVRWCGTAAWLPAYPTATRVVHALGLSFSSAGFLIANIASLAALLVVWFGWARDLSRPRGLVLLLLFALFPGAVYNFAVFPVSMALVLLTGGLLAGARQRYLTMAILVGLANLSYPSAWFASIGIIIGLVIVARPKGLIAMVKGALWGAASLLSVLAMFIHDQVAFGHWNAFFLLESEAKPKSTVAPGIPSTYLLSIHQSGVNLLVVQMILALSLIALAVAVTWWPRRGAAVAPIDVLASCSSLAVGIGLLFSLSGGSWNRSILLAAPCVLCLRRIPMPLLVVLLAMAGTMAAIVSLFVFQGKVI
jgi:hypothetical protein